MKANIFPIYSNIHNKNKIESEICTYIESLKQLLPQIEILRHNDMSQYGEGSVDLIFVATGGTEEIFLQQLNNYPNIYSSCIRLLTNGSNNSLAASMEILSYLKQNGYKGEIIHGDTDYIAQYINKLVLVNEAKNKLKGQKIGIIGTPSDWLIASTYNQDIIREKLGVEIENINMEELLLEIKKHDYPIDARKRLQTCPSDFFIGALEIYGGLKRIIEKHSLNAITLRCFDLLSAVRNTGCLSLALLNDEGIPSSCEGDVPSLLSMMISNALIGISGFQANPSKIDPLTNELTFAHCTIPLNMVTSYKYDTHFESGIGVAIHGEMPIGEATIFKVSGDLSRSFIKSAQLKQNLNEKNLCRTQVVLQADDTANYFLHNPIANHHIILSGNHANLLEMFMQEL